MACGGYTYKYRQCAVSAEMPTNIELQITTWSPHRLVLCFENSVRISPQIQRIPLHSSSSILLHTSYTKLAFICSCSFHTIGGKSLAFYALSSLNFSWTIFDFDEYEQKYHSTRKSDERVRLWELDFENKLKAKYEGGPVSN